MKDLSKLILPLGFVALIGACAPYPPYPGQGTNQAQAQAKPVVKTPQQTAADEKQRQIAESRRRLEREEARRLKNESQESQRSNPTTPKTQPKPTKPKYPSATAVPGKPGFVFNPYTQNIVDVKGIGSGKLVRDPEDNNPAHKFRVP